MTPCLATPVATDAGALDCSVLPPTLSVVIISVVVTASVLWLLIDVWIHARGARWLATLIGGVLFGEVVEYVNVHSGGHSYCYPVGWNVLGVPFWVPVGWGGIIYAATWTAKRLRLPPLGRALTAAFLAASIDFSLDPVANALGLWRWRQLDVSFCGVPYDNYVGWYLIVFVYALSADFVLGRLKKLSKKGEGSPARDWLWSDVVQVVAGLLCAACATGVLFVAQWVVTRLHYSSTADGGKVSAWCFIGLTTLAALVTLVFAGRSASSPPPAGSEKPSVNWPVMLVPGIMHLTCYVLFLSFADWSQTSMLVAAIPIQLLAGAFVFSTPWRNKLT